jgi:hypothetical protein
VKSGAGGYVSQRNTSTATEQKNTTSSSTEAVCTGYLP